MDIYVVEFRILQRIYFVLFYANRGVEKTPANMHWNFQREIDFFLKISTPLNAMEAQIKINSPCEFHREQRIHKSKMILLTLPVALLSAHFILALCSV